jgi:hypothetical protein
MPSIFLAFVNSNVDKDERGWIVQISTCSLGGIALVFFGVLARIAVCLAQDAMTNISTNNSGIVWSSTKTFLKAEFYFILVLDQCTCTSQKPQLTQMNHIIDN